MIISPDLAVEKLKKSGIVAIPTETVYGLAAVATDPKAVAKIYLAKNRPVDNPLICHFYSLDQLEEYISDIPDYAKILISHFSPGPLSYLFDIPTDSVLKPSTAGLDSVVVRIPRHPLALQIIQKLNIPLAAPSANTSSRFSPTSAIMVEKDLGDKIDGIVDGGRSEIGLESTIIDCRHNSEMTILRQGSIGISEIQDRLKLFDLNPKIQISNLEATPEQVIPGSKYPHYSPQTPIFEIQEFPEIPENGYFGVLGLQDKISEAELLNTKPGVKFFNLGKNEQELAFNLYQKLFELDQENLDIAFFLKEKLSPSPLGKALGVRFEKILKNPVESQNK